LVIRKTDLPSEPYKQVANSALPENSDSADLHDKPAVDVTNGKAIEEEPGISYAKERIATDPNGLPHVRLAVFGNSSSPEPSTKVTANKNAPADKVNVDSDPQVESQNSPEKPPPQRDTPNEVVENTPAMDEEPSDMNSMELGLEGYYLQFGSFQDQMRAKALQDRLAKKGYVVRIPTIANNASGDRWYSVRVDFTSLNDATKARDTYLKQEGTRPVLGKQ